MDQSLVNNVKYSVASLENDKLGDWATTPWTFHLNNTMEATGHWKGQWIDHRIQGINAVSVEITLNNGSHDGFDVYFLGPTHFIAVKGGLFYRLGKKLGY